MIKRHISSSLLEALSDTPVVLLTGARQTGKSTLVKAIASDYHPARYITLDNLSILAAVRPGPRPAYLLCMGSQISQSERTGDRIL
jgi:energy-coupling factor transporter ATP-binding protein EcfA2